MKLLAMDNNVYLQILDMNNTDLLKLYYGLLQDKKEDWAIIVQNILITRDIKDFKELIKIN